MTKTQTIKFISNKPTKIKNSPTKLKLKGKLIFARLKIQKKTVNKGIIWTIPEKYQINFVLYLTYKTPIRKKRVLLDFKTKSMPKTA